MYKKVNNGGDDVEREEISAGNQGKVKELVLFSLFTALTAIGAFIRVPVPLCPFTLQLLFTTLSGLILGSRKGAASVAVYVVSVCRGFPFYAGRRAGIYFPAYFRLSFGVHRGSLAYGEIVGAYGKTVICPHFICEPGRTSCGLPFGMVYVYVINNYYLNTPIGIWPVVLYCFLLAVPGDICLCVLAAVLAKKLYRAGHAW